MTQQINNSKIWDLYMARTVGLEQAVDLASKVENHNGEYRLPADAETMCAAMLTLGDDVFQYMRSDKFSDQMEYFGRVGAYHRIQKAIEDLYPNESGHITDPWLGDSFSDIYKDRNGFRPTGFTAQQMRDWFKQDKEIRDKEVAA